MSLELICNIATGVLVPVIVFLFKYINDVKSDLSKLQVNIATNYANKDDIQRLEQKIDNLQNLIINMIQTQK